MFRYATSFSKSYEFGETEGLNIFKGEVCKLQSNNEKNFKVPNIGWYQLDENLENSNEKKLKS